MPIRITRDAILVFPFRNDTHRNSYVYENCLISIGTSSALANRVTLANLSSLSNPMGALLPPATNPQTTPDFVKLFESLIGGEVTPDSPTQIHEDDEVDTKGAKPQKNPRPSRDPGDSKGQQGDGLLAMMAAASFARTKPTPMPAPSLSFGRSAEEDSFVQSSKTTEEQAVDSSPAAPVLQPVVPFIPLPGPQSTPASGEATRPVPIPRAGLPDRQPVSAQAQMDPIPGSPAPVERAPVEHALVERAHAEPALRAHDAPAVEPIQIPVPVEARAVAIMVPISTQPRDRITTQDRARPVVELSTGSRQAPALPPALGQVRTAHPQPDEPIAFVARLTEHDEPEEPQTAKPSTLPPGQKLPALPQTAHSEMPAKLEPENVPTNPKSTSQAAASDTATAKAKPLPAEKPAENVPTNPKSASPITLPAREAPPQGQPNSTRTASAPEVKQSTPTHETELQSKPTIRSEPAREISIRIPSTGGSGNVDVQIVERDGKVQVTVRGSDNHLNAALRSDLTDLVHTLDQKGYKTETWTPADTYPLTSAKGPEVQTPGRGESSPDWSGNQQNSGDQGNPGGSQQQRRQQQERPAWLIELERRLETEG